MFHLRQPHRRLFRPCSIAILAAVTGGLAANANATILNVPADFATIQAAINAAVNGDEVLIAPGTYTQTDIQLTNKAITVRGSGGAAVTIIQFPGATIFELLTLTNVESDTIIDGLTFANTSPGTGIPLAIVAIGSGSFPTIQNCAFVNNGGKPCIGGLGGPGISILDCTFTDNDSPCIAFNSDDDITIDGCTFTGNSTALGSGGAAIQLVACGAAITNCTFNSNSWTGTDTTGGGAIYARPGAFDITIDNCTFNTNPSLQTHGGGIFAHIVTGNGGSVTISNCEFTGNTAATIGGGIFAEIMAGATGGASIEGCTFEGNSAATGGGAYLRAGPTATGCTFTNNLTVGGDAGRGAGLAVENANATNCMFTGNQSSGNGGAMYALGASSVLTNCNASGNSAAVGLGGGLNSAPGSVVALVDSVLCANTPSQIEVGGFLSASNVIACDQPMGPVGACCLPQGDCVVTSETNCVAAKGTYQGDRTACEMDVCPPPKPSCVSDIAPADGDDAVNVLDLLKIISDWGPCL